MVLSGVEQKIGRTVVHEPCYERQNKAYTNEQMNERNKRKVFLCPVLTVMRLNLSSYASNLWQTAGL